jgi:hypothetical protein
MDACFCCGSMPAAAVSMTILCLCGGSMSLSKH